MFHAIIAISSRRTMPRERRQQAAAQPAASTIYAITPRKAPAGLLRRHLLCAGTRRARAAIAIAASQLHLLPAHRLLKAIT